MDARPYRLLVLHDDPVALFQATSALKERRYLVVSADSPEQARRWFAEWPIDLLITGARVRGTSGLQFLAAMRQRHPELAGLVMVDARDEPLETEAWRHGASLIVRPYEQARFLMLVAESLAAIRRRQRWPRKRVGRHVPVRIGRAPGKLVDVSYGGLRFEFAGESYDLPSPITIDFPDSQIQVRANLVWSSRSDDGTSSVCGAGLIDETHDESWRRFVDLLPADQHA
jgi:DNA-binding response OmpR family regulator